jgi:hypothetical protein
VSLLFLTQINFKFRNLRVLLFKLSLVGFLLTLKEEFRSCNCSVFLFPFFCVAFSRLLVALGRFELIIQVFVGSLPSIIFLT